MLVYQRLCRSDGQCPRAQNLKNVGCSGHQNSKNGQNPLGKE